METTDAVDGLGALAHAGRLNAFRLLVQAGAEGLPAGEIATRLGMPASSLSTNLHILAHAGLVTSRRESRSIIYTADYDAMRTPAGLDAIARYADGIGPWIPQVVTFGADGSAASTGLAGQARSRGLAVHPYTIRADQLPAGEPSLAAVHDALFRLAGADGAFSDFPDLTRAALR